MNCLKCQTQNEVNAQFCKNCGTNLHYAVYAPKANNKTADILLVVFVGIGFFCGIMNFLINRFVDNWYESPIKYVQGFFWILQNLILILPALAIRNKILKIVSVIFTSLLVIDWIYSNIQFLMR